MIAGIMADPCLVMAGSFSQNFLGDFGFFANLPEEVGNIVFASQEGEVSIDDDAIKAMIKPLQVGPEEFKEELHWRLFLGFECCYENTRRSPNALQALPINPKVFEVRG